VTIQLDEGMISEGQLSVFDMSEYGVQNLQSVQLSESVQVGLMLLYQLSNEYGAVVLDGGFCLVTGQ